MSTNTTTEAPTRVEQVGVEFIPDAERDSNPRNLFSVFAGVNLGWVCAIYGWLGVVLGSTSPGRSPRTWSAP